MEKVFVLQLFRFNFEILIKFGLFIDQTNTYARQFCSSNGIVRSFEKYLIDQMSQTKTNICCALHFEILKHSPAKFLWKKSWKSFNENDKHSNFRPVLTDLTVQLPELMIIMIIIPVMITMTNIPISVILITMNMIMIVIPMDMIMIIILIAMKMIMILITTDMIMIRGEPTLCF